MTILQQRDQARLEDRLRACEESRSRLRLALKELLPGHQVWIFGSLLRSERFDSASDVDIAIGAEPEGMTIYGLTASLEERVGRPVDVVLLPQSRFREKIMKEGELWTL